MARFLTAGLALVLMVAGSGCANNNCQQCNGGRQGMYAGAGGNGNQCRNGLCNRGNGGQGQGQGQGQAGAGGYGGPGGAAVAYPYYTVRAPRDFLSPNPRGIGP